MTPNHITLLRAFLVLPFAGFWLLDIHIFALFTLIIIMLTDFLDGWLARRTNQTTDFGTWLDPLCDKLVIATGFLLCAMDVVAPAGLLIIMLVRDLTIDSYRHYLSQRGISMPASWLAKWKTTLQFMLLVFALLFLTFHNLVFETLAILTAVFATLASVISGIQYVRRTR